MVVTCVALVMLHYGLVVTCRTLFIVLYNGCYVYDPSCYIMMLCYTAVVTTCSMGYITRNMYDINCNITQLHLLQLLQIMFDNGCYMNIITLVK